MKHNLKWSEDLSTLGGFFKACMKPGDAWAKCSKCGRFALSKKGATAPLFWVDGRFVAKRLGLECAPERAA